MEKARKKEVTVEPILWHYEAAKDGTFPVKLKVTSNRITKNYPIQYKGKNVSVSKDKWTAITTTKVRGETLKLQDQIDAYRVRGSQIAENITKGGRPFSFDAFEKDFFAKETPGGFMAIFRKYLDKLLTEERIGTYRTYKSAFNAFAGFLDNKDITAYAVTPELLNSFERHLKTERKAKRGTMGIYMEGGEDRPPINASRKAGPTTVSIYTRVLRTIYNLCTDEDPNLRQHYPFGNKKRGKYKILVSHKGAKKGDAFTIEQLKLFVATTPDKDSPQWEAKMYWLFSFYCQGMNFRDICYLKYKDIQGEVIRYTRQKTKRTEESEIIEVPVSDSIREIIIALGNPDKRPSAYVFSILDRSETDALKIENTALQKIKITNKWLKSLCKANDLPEITTYWSRHTYASLLKGSGVPVEMIRELLGHSDLKTTEHYLKRFDITQKRDANEKLAEIIKAGSR